MEGSDTLTHDFMNVESFSRLPFTPLSSPNDNLMIRLFGKEFGGGNPATVTTNNLNSTATATVIRDGAQENEETHRKFDCQYCGRNFRTSQALGGHQNAHRRERLQARQTDHFQPTMVPRSSVKPQLHNFLSHHHATATAPPYGHHPGTNYNNCVRCFGTFRQTVPINGRPLPPWKFPTMRKSFTTFSRVGLSNSSDTGAAGCPSLYMHESDQVSLDLHL